MNNPIFWLDSSGLFAFPVHAQKCEGAGVALTERHWNDLREAGELARNPQTEPENFGWFRTFVSSFMDFIIPDVIQDNGFVVGRGMSVSAAVVAGISLQVALLADTHGNVGLAITPSTGTALPQLTVTSDRIFAWSSTVWDMGYVVGNVSDRFREYVLDAYGGFFGGSYAAGTSLGFSVLFDAEGIVGVQINAGLGVAPPFAFEVHMFLGQTTIIPLLQITNPF